MFALDVERGSGTGEADDADTETGLYYYRARYYDVAAGRFLSEDPAGFDADVDFYTYTGNNPVNWNDPEGLKKARVCWQPLRRWRGLIRFWRHTYIVIVNDDGTDILDKDGKPATYGVLGDPGSTRNQKPRRGDPRNSGKCKDLPDCPNEVEKLHRGIYANQVVLHICSGGLCSMAEHWLRR